MEDPSSSKEDENPIKGTSELISLGLACQSNSLVIFRKILQDSPGLDVNRGNNILFPFHYVIRWERDQMLALLLRYPGSDPNVCNKDGDTPLLMSIKYQKMSCCTLLLNDPRVKVEIADAKGNRPLWHVCRKGYIDVLKRWIISKKPLDFSGDGIGGLRSEAIYGGRKTGAATVRLIDRWQENPEMCRFEVGLELEARFRVAYCFACVVLACDGFLRARRLAVKSDHTITGKLRFYIIVCQLPMELQMTLCHRVFGSSQDIVDTEIFNSAAKFVVSAFASAS